MRMRLVTGGAIFLTAASPVLAQDPPAPLLADPTPAVEAPAPDLPSTLERAAPAPVRSEAKPAAQAANPAAKKPKAGRAIGETVGGLAGGAAAAATGPVGGAIGGFVGKKVGGGLGSIAQKLFGGKKKDVEQAEAEPERTATPPDAGPAAFNATANGSASTQAEP